MFQKANKTKAKGRLMLAGPAGSGKTRSALRIAEGLVDSGQRIAFVDTEAGSASKYSDLHDFDVLNISDSFEPKKLLEAVNFAAKEGYGVVIVDSLTPFWKGKNGFLALIDDDVARQKGRGGKGDSFGAWKTVDPLYNRWIQDLWNAPIHIIFCVQSKITREKDPADGKIKNMGYQAEFRDTFIYLPDVECQLDADHKMCIGKSRCDALDGKVFTKPGKDFADIFKTWLEDGTEKPTAAAQVTPPVKDDGTALLTLIAAVVTEDNYREAVASYKANADSLTNEAKTAAVHALQAKKKDLQQ